MTKKEMEKIRLQILKAQGKNGLRQFNKLSRTEGSPRGKQIHDNNTYYVSKGSSRKPKHRNREFE